MFRKGNEKHRKHPLIVFLYAAILLSLKFPEYMVEVNEMETDSILSDGNIVLVFIINVVRVVSASFPVVY